MGSVGVRILTPSQKLIKLVCAHYRPKMHHILQRMQDKVISHYDAVTIGECPFTDDPNMLLPYVLPESHELNMVNYLLFPQTPKEWKEN